MAHLVEDMIQVDPTKRPTIDTVVQRYREICHSLSWWTLRSRLKQNEEAEVPGQTTLLNIKHFFQTVGHILQFRSSVPTS